MDRLSKMKRVALLLLLLIVSDHGFGVHARVMQTQQAMTAAALTKAIRIAGALLKQKDQILDWIPNTPTHEYPSTPYAKVSIDRSTLQEFGYIDPSAEVLPAESEALERFRALSGESTSNKLRFRQYNGSGTKCDISQYDGVVPESRRQLLYELGQPKAGVFTHANTFYRYNYTSTSWEYNTQRNLVNGWTPVRDFSGEPSERYFAEALDVTNPRLIASADVMEVIGCPTNGTYVFKAGPHVAALYLKYEPRFLRWRWSPDNTHWMLTDQIDVEGGEWNGMKPVVENERIIDALQAFTLLGHGSYPLHEDQNWLNSSPRFRELMRNWWDDLKAKVQQGVVLAEHLVEVTGKLASLKLTALKQRLSEMWGHFKQDVVKNLPKWLFSAAYGFANGLFYGILQHIEHTAHSCDTLKPAFEALIDRFKICFEAMVDFLINIDPSQVVTKFKAMIGAQVDVAAALFNLVNACPALRDMMITLFVTIAVMVLISMALVATVLGAVVKVVLIIVDIASSAAFLISNTEELFKAIGSFKAGADNSEVVSKILFHLFGDVGCVLAAVLTVGELNEASHEALKLVNESKFLTKFKFGEGQIQKGIAQLQKLIGAMTGARKGAKPNVSEFVDPAHAPATPRAATPETTPTTPTTPHTPAVTSTPSFPVMKLQEIDAAVSKKEPTWKADWTNAAKEVNKNKREITRQEGSMVVFLRYEAGYTAQGLKVVERLTVVMSTAPQQVTGILVVSKLKAYQSVENKLELVMRLELPGGFTSANKYPLPQLLSGAKTLPAKIFQQTHLVQLKNAISWLGKQHVFHNALSKAEHFVLWSNGKKLLFEIVNWGKEGEHEGNHEGGHEAAGGHNAAGQEHSPDDAALEQTVHQMQHLVNH